MEVTTSGGYYSFGRFRFSEISFPAIGWLTMYCMPPFPPHDCQVLGFDETCKGFDTCCEWALPTFHFSKKRALPMSYHCPYLSL